MAFSEDTIGFYLAIEDQMTPALSKARNAYQAFVNDIDKLSNKAYKVASKGSAALASLFKLDGLEQEGVDKYKAMHKSIAKAIKPVKQPVELIFTGKSKTDLSKSVETAIGKMLKKATIRLSATMPLKRNPKFDTTQSLLEAYGGLIQPPDMRGGFQGLPKFREGGEVTAKGGRKGVDSVLAMLAPGEIVLPVDVADNLKEIAGRKRLPKGLEDAAANIESLASSLTNMQAEAEKGLDPDVVQRYNKGVAALASETEKLNLASDKLGSEAYRKLRPQIVRLANQSMRFKTVQEQVTEALDDAKAPAGNLTEGYQGLMNSMEGVKGGLVGALLAMEGQEAAAQDATASIGEYLSNAAAMGRTREEQIARVRVLTEAQSALTGNTVSLVHTLTAEQELRQAGIKDLKTLESLAPRVAMLQKAGFADAADSVYRYNSELGLGADGAMDLAASILGLSDKLEVSTEQLDDAVMAAKSMMVFKDMDAALKPKAVQDYAAAVAMMADNFVQSAPDIAQALARASTDVQAFNEIADGMGGMSPQELRDRIAAGDMTGVITDMQGNLKQAMAGMDALGKTQFLERISGGLGTDVDELNKLLGSDLAKSANMANEQLVQAGQGTAFLQERVAGASTTFGRFMTGVSNFVGKNASGLIGVLEDINFVAIALGAHMIGLDRGVGMLAKRLWTALVPSLTATAPATAAVGAGSTGATVGLSAMATAVWAAMAPLLPFIAAGVALGAVLWWLNRRFNIVGKTVAYVQGLWSGFSSALGEGSSLISEALVPLKKKLQPTLDLLSVGMEPVLDVFKSLWGFFSATDDSPLDGWTKSGDSFGRMLGTGLVSGITAAIDGLVLLIEYGGHVKDRLTSIGEVIGGGLGAAWFALQQGIGGAKAALLSVIAPFQSVWQYITDMDWALTGNSLVPSFDMLKGVVDTVSNLFSGSAGAAFEAFKGVVLGLKDMVGGLLTGLTALPGKALEATKALGGKAVSAVSSVKGFFTGGDAMGGRDLDMARLGGLVERGFTALPAIIEEAMVSAWEVVNTHMEQRSPFTIPNKDDLQGVMPVRIVADETAEQEHTDAMGVQALLKQVVELLAAQGGNAKPAPDSRAVAARQPRPASLDTRRFAAGQMEGS